MDPDETLAIITETIQNEPGNLDQLDQKESFASPKHEQAKNCNRDYDTDSLGLTKIDRHYDELYRARMLNKRRVQPWLNNNIPSDCSSISSGVYNTRVYPSLASESTDSHKSTKD